MSPGFFLVLLAAMLMALLPVWRLNRAAWRRSVLLWAWVGYTVALLVVLRLPATGRFLVPILVLAFVAPFVAGPERLSRVLGPRTPPQRPVVDVTPQPPRGLPEPPPDVPADDEDGHGIG